MSAARAVYRSLSSSAQAMLGGIETDKVSSADVELSWNAAEELIASGVITADVEQDETRDGRSRGTFHALTDLGAQVRAFVWAQ